MTTTIVKVAALLGLALPVALAAEVIGEQGNLYAATSPGSIRIIVPDRSDPVERYAAEELRRHVERVTAVKPAVIPASRANDPLGGDVLVLGQIADHPLLKDLADKGVFKPSVAVQGYAMRIAASPLNGGGRHWMVVLCGADPLGVLYAVRDFCHYHLYTEGKAVVLRPVDERLAPRIKARILSESGANLFGKSTYNDDDRALKLNHYFLDWLSEWKATHLLVWWCCLRQYDPLWKELVEAAHVRGLKVLRGFVPYRPDHEGAPKSLKAYKAGTKSTELANCPRDPAAREWYTQRLVELVTRKPRIDGVVIESPYHDGVCCTCPKCAKHPMPETEMMDSLFGTLRKVRSDLTLGRCIKRPVPNEAAAKRLAADLAPLDPHVDWYYNTYRDRAHRRRWHAIGPKCATYLRTFRSALKGKDVAGEIDFLFNDFRMSAERGVVAHGFCYRFYGGRYGSFRVEDDAAMMKAWPGKKGPLSLALVCEAAFDPFVSGRARAQKIARIRAVTLTDYPRQTGPKVVTPMTDGGTLPKPSRFFRYHYGVRDASFCGAQVCVDFDNDGTREIVFGSRQTHRLSMLRAADGKLVWSKRFPGDYQSVSAYDLDGDGACEILYATSNPGRLYVLDRAGEALKSWDADDHKLGNAPVVIDGDGDGVLDGYFGSRNKYLIRLNMRDLTLVRRRGDWVQCGCHTSAMDVDGDGRWDLFAGRGDINAPVKGSLHRYDPVSLESAWAFPTGHSAASSDPVLIDLDGDGRVEVVQSVHNYRDDPRQGVSAYDVDGRRLWTVEGIAGEDTPSAGDLDGDGKVDLVGMTFGGEVYRLDAKGRVRWRIDLRPELDDDARAYMAPILCDVNGDARLEILAMTNGRYLGAGKAPRPEDNGVLYALSADGKVLDRFDLGQARYWGHAFYCNVDDDATMELVVSGCGGLDVIKTNGLGPDTEHFQRRRSYRRMNAVPWVYEDDYFIYRGRKDGVTHRADGLVLCKDGDGYRGSGRFVTAVLVLPPGCAFDRLRWRADTPAGTGLRVSVADKDGTSLLADAKNGQELGIDTSVRIEFVLSTTNRLATPRLDSYSLSFRRARP